MDRERTRAVVWYFYDMPTKRELLEQERTAPEVDNGRSQEIAVKLHVLSADAAHIWRCIDALNDRQKAILLMRSVGQSWVQISIALNASNATVRRWYAQTLDLLGDAFCGIPMAEELINRAMLARK